MSYLVRWMKGGWSKEEGYAQNSFEVLAPLAQVEQPEMRHLMIRERQRSEEQDYLVTGQHSVCILFI